MTDNDDNAGMTPAQSPEAIGVHTTGLGWSLEGEHDWADCSVEFSHGGYFYTIYEPGRELPVAFVIGQGSGYEEDAEVSRREALVMAASRELLAVAVAIAPYLGATDANDWRGLKDDDAISMPVKMRVGDLRALKAAIAKALGQ